MPAIQDDVTSRYFGHLDIEAYGRGFTETYDLKATASWDEVCQQFRALAKFRAATLGRGARLTYAMVSEQGPARKSRVVIETPLAGTTGVHFNGNGITSEGALNCNTLATGLRMRFQTQVGDHYTRLLRGLCDAWINARKWQPTVGDPDLFLFNDYTIPLVITGTGTEVPAGELWVLGRTYTTAQLRRFYTYEEAWQQLLKAIFQYTNYKRPNINSEGVKVDNTVTLVNWYEIKYRGVGDRDPGVPSKR